MRVLILAIAFLLSFSGFSQEINYIPNQVLVRFEPNTDVDMFWSRFDKDFNHQTPIISTRLLAPYMNIWKVKYAGNVNTRDVVQALLRKQEVVVAQVNHKIYSRTTPNDPLFGTQWQWENIAAEQAWDVTTGGLTANGDTIVVAIIDDGTQLDHPDLAANIWHNYAEIPNNGIDDDGNGYIDDFNGWNVIDGNNDVNNGGHGISVAGMIGAVGNDNNQGVGANWNVKLMTIVGGTAEESEVIESYSYALNFRKKYNETNGAEGAFVVATNSSWGLDNGDPNDAPLWCAFYDSLGVQGILSCGATANNAVDVDAVGDLPTACPSEYLIAVTATDVNDFRDFSAWGLTTIDVGAPGDEIYTTESGSGYGFTSGTSFASPLTAGVIALLYSAPCPDIAALALTSPDAAALLVRDYIFDGVDTTAQLKSEIKTGGRINASTSMQLLMAGCGACTPPFSISTTDLTDVTATLNFSTLNDGANLFIRPAGTTVWDTTLNATSPYSLTGLTGCSNYEVTLQSICADSLSDLSPIFSFKTDGCCELPNNFHAENINNDQAVLAWNSVLAATNFEVIYAKDPFTDWDTLSTNNTTMTLANLSDCTIYQVKIKTQCGGENIPYSDPIEFTTSGCGTCIDSVYCESYGENNAFEYIDTLSIDGIFTNPTGANDGGYAFFSNLNISLIQGIEYKLTLTPGYADTEYAENIRVWIDFNQNAIFEPNEAVVAPDFSIKEATTFAFSIPLDALPGLTRMRVKMDYTSSSVVDSCGPFSYGELEDYCITIAGTDACLAPFNIQTTEILGESALISYSTINDGANILYRQEGVADWDTISNASSPYQLTNLIPCANYEIKLQSICADSLSSLSISYFFKTDGCCELPNSFAINQITDHEAVLSWDGVLAATTFDVIYAQAPFTTWDTVSTSAPYSMTLTGLEGCTEYQVKIRPNCSGDTIPFSETFTFKTTGCGACLDLFYCESFGNNATEWIDSIEVIDVFQKSTGEDPDGYVFFSDENINFTQETDYEMIITPGYSGTKYSEYVKAWIDYNQNGIFEPMEILFAPDTKINTATTYPFTIPEDAIPGSTRMRVRLDYDSILDSCGEFTYGEVEDYCVTIKEKGYCLGPDSLYVDDIEYYSATLNWAAVDSSISYIVRHRLPNEDWESVTTTGNTYLLTNLDECTEYETQIRAVCSNGLGKKTFNTFKTKCTTGTSTPFGENAFKVMPNPFSEEFEVEIIGYTTKDIQVRMFDMLGREIPIKTSGSQGKMTITPSNSISEGVYTLQLRTPNHAGVVRVTKQ